MSPGSRYGRLGSCWWNHWRVRLSFFLSSSITSLFCQTGVAMCAEIQRKDFQKLNKIAFDVGSLIYQHYSDGHSNWRMYWSRVGKPSTAEMKWCLRMVSLCWTWWVADVIAANIVSTTSQFCWIGRPNKALHYGGMEELARSWCTFLWANKVNTLVLQVGRALGLLVVAMS